MAMAAHFFNHVGHLGLGVVSLSGVLNSVYQQNCDNINRHKITSGYISNIREYIGNENTKGTIPLVKRSKNLHMNSVIDKMPQLLQIVQEQQEQEENQKAKTTCNRVPLMPEVLKTLATVSGNRCLESEQEFASKQITAELRALIKQHGFKMNDILIVDNDDNDVDNNDDHDECKINAQTKNVKNNLLKSKSSKNLRQSIQLLDRAKSNLQPLSPTTLSSLQHRAEFQDRKSIKEEEACRTLVSECKAAAAAASAAAAATVPKG